MGRQPFTPMSNYPGTRKADFKCMEVNPYSFQIFFLSLKSAPKLINYDLINVSTLFLYFSYRGINLKIFSTTSAPGKNPKEHKLCTTQREVTRQKSPWGWGERSQIDKQAKNNLIPAPLTSIPPNVVLQYCFKLLPRMSKKPQLKI